MTEETAPTTPNAPLAPPGPGNGPAIWDLVMADMAERDAMGARKYGQRLVAFDGREPLVDAYQEALDLAVYLRKAIAQRGAKAAPQPAPLSPGEQLVWAASYVRNIDAGHPPINAAKLASSRVEQLRSLTPLTVEPAVVAHIEQMRGGR